MKTEAMTQVKSTAITHIHHDPKTQVCTVRFHSGKQHTYQPMPTEEFAAFSGSPSVGKHFAEHVRNNERYTSSLVDDTETAA